MRRQRSSARGKLGPSTSTLTSHARLGCARVRIILVAPDPSPASPRRQGQGRSPHVNWLKSTLGCSGPRKSGARADGPSKESRAVLCHGAIGEGGAPHGGLCSILDAELPKEALDVNFHGRLGDVEFTSDVLIGSTSHNLR